MKKLAVAAGVIYLNNKILLSTRPTHKSYSLNWEFPGGKIEPTESPVTTVGRELKEELDLIVSPKDCQLIDILQYTYIQPLYPNIVELHIFLIKKILGTPKPLEGQELYWHTLTDDLKLSPLLPTTKPILKLVYNFLNP